MLRAEYNRLYDVWLVAKPEYTDTADWTKLWEMFTKGIYIQEKPVVKSKSTMAEFKSDVPWL